MPSQRIREYLEDRGVHYETIRHPKTYTAQRTAQSAHIPGSEVAKTVVVSLDGRLILAVVPASQNVDLRRLAKLAGATRARLATESEFARAFPECEVGAMPPLGSLYGLPVWVDQTLVREREIAFNAGTHTELIRMAYRDFDDVIHPCVADFGSSVAA